MTDNNLSLPEDILAESIAEAGSPSMSTTR